MRAAKMDHDLGLDERPDEDVFDDMLLHVDGWLCEIKDVQIRDGLHILGAAPDGRRRGRSGARDAAGAADVGRRADRARPAGGARPERGRRRDRDRVDAVEEQRTRLVAAPAGRRLESRTRSTR